MKKIKGIIAAVLCMTLLAGCGGTNSSTGNSSNSTVTSDAAETIESKESSVTETETATDDTADSVDTSAPESEQTDIVYPESIRVSAFKGPTAMGLSYFMNEDEELDLPYDFTISAAIDEISPLIIQGKTDIACVPANLASVLYNKTEGGVKVLAVNTLGVLYICENGTTVTDIQDLKGRTIFASGKGATPEYALNYILKQNGIDPEKDVTIEWKSEHSECLTSLTANEGSVALLPQPFVTTAQTKAEGINVVIDITEEWEKLDNGSACLTGVVVATSEFVDLYPEVVDEFLSKYAESVNYVNDNVAEGAQLIGKYEIVPAAVAEKAIPECNIVCITGAEMKDKLSGYLGVLFEQEPTSVGGALPADDFYYGA